MEIIDITGPIYEGMWEYGFPYGHFRIIQLDFEYVGHRLKHEGFEGLVGSTGTRLVTSAVYYGYKKGISTHEIDLKKIVNVDAYVLQINYNELDTIDGRKIIQLKDIKKAELEEIPENIVIIVSTGYGQNLNKKDYINKSPYFKREALFYLLDKKPTLIASDIPTWENRIHPEHTFERLFGSGTLMMSSCVNLEKIKKSKVKFIALPLKILNVCQVPTRAVVIIE